MFRNSFLWGIARFFGCVSTEPVYVPPVREKLPKKGTRLYKRIASSTVKGAKLKVHGPLKKTEFAQVYCGRGQTSFNDQHAVDSDWKRALDKYEVSKVKVKTAKMPRNSECGESLRADSYYMHK